MTEDTVQRLMGLAREAIRSAVLSETRGGRNYESDADEDMADLESALREALDVQGLTDAEVHDGAEEEYRRAHIYDFKAGARWAERTLCAKNGLKLKEQDHG